MGDSPGFDVTLPAGASDGGDGEPITVGRYVLGEALGSGGMGVVHRARDPDLDRDLAIKLVLPAIAGKRAHERLLSEARAMAKLRHPNVVPVFDVGITERGVYVVMPLVPGGTLHDWLNAEPRPWREIVKRFVAAGRGLAAAHTVGIVHRDFKPRNVLLDEHGTVMVADFGLANAAAAASATESGDAHVTSVVGTPAYMAPEQAAGRAVDARADQFSFCVSFWEGLHGQRPSAAETAEGRPGDTATAPADATSTDSSPVMPPPAHDSPPTWLQLVIARGFSDDPARRWPSMANLLDEIELRIQTDAARPASRAPRIVLGIAAASGVAGAALLVRSLRDNADDATKPALVVTAPRQLTRIGGCVYSPAFIDDDTVAFDVTSPGHPPDVYTYQLSSGELRRITDAPTWEWRVSPGRDTGELIYLVTDIEHDANSYVAARDRASGVERRLAAGSAMAATATSDAYFYVRSDGNELRSVRGNVDEHVVRLTQVQQARELAATRDGRTLAVVGRVSNAPAGVCLVDVVTRTETCPPHHDYPVPSRADFGPSGDLYLAGADGIRAYPATGDDRLVVPGVHGYGGLTVSPRGKTLAYSDCTAMGSVDVVGAARVALTEADLLTDPVAGPGGRVAWVRRRREIFVRTADGTIRDLLGPGRQDSLVASPAFDDTGKQLAFSRTGHGAGLWVVDTDIAGLPRQITFGERDSLPAFLRDGSIVFAREEDEQTYLFRVVPGGEPTRASARPREIMDVDRKSGRVLLRSPDQGFLYWWDPATGQETAGPPTDRQTAVNGRIAISPDGNWMLYATGALGHELRRTPTAEWKPEPVFATAPENTLEAFAITDEGYPLVIEKRWQGELYAVDATAGRL